MPKPQYSSVYLRYLRARLANILRPGFWGTGIFLIVLTIIVGKYLLPEDVSPQAQIENREREQQQENQQENSENLQQITNTTNNSMPDVTALDSEDQAIASNIDIMPNLLSDFVQANISATASRPTNNKQKKNVESLLEQVNNQKNNPSLDIPKPANNFSSTITKNPFLEQSQNLLTFNSYNNQFVNQNQNSFLPNNSGLVYTTTSNQNITPVVSSSLQLAINQSSYRNQVNSITPNRQIIPYTPNNMGVGYMQPTTQPTNNLPTTYANQFNNLQTGINTSGIRQPTMGRYNTPNNNYLRQSPNPGNINPATQLTNQQNGNYNFNNVRPNYQYQSQPSNFNYPGQMQQNDNGN
jgi:hypothetical protein